MRIRAGLGSVVAVGLIVGLVPGSVQGAEFGVPGAPSSVSSSLVSGGVRVSWDAPAVSSPPVSHYVVHAGQGSCPVRVPASATSAVMPVVARQKRVRPQVQAVNALGYSADGVSADAVNVRGKANSQYRNVQVLEFSDFHGAIEDGGSSIGAALLASAFKRDRAAVPSTVVVSAGDQFGGSPVLSAQFDELPTVEALNLMGLDVATTGNHEHDKDLSHLRSMIAASKFPWVVSNYSTLQPLNIGGSKVDPFTIVDADGVKVGVVGMNTEDTADLTPAGNLSFGRDGGKTVVISPKVRPVNRAAAAARAAGADVVVGALHQGWNANVGGEPVGRLVDVARELRGVDLAFGGHTHQTFASVVDGLPVAQTRNAGIEYTRTQVCLDTSSGKVVGSAVEFVTEEDLAGLTPDRRTSRLIEEYKQKLGARLDVQIGVVEDVFPRGGNPPVERSEETPMGTYVAEALRSKYGTDIGYLTGGGIRDTFPAAGYEPLNKDLRRPGGGTSGPYDVTLGDALGVFPFNDSTATSTVTGRNLWAALENGVSQYPGAGRFPQVAGIRFSFDPTRPVGQRVQSVTWADGRPIAPDDTVYTIATLAYLVNGVDDYKDYFTPVSASVRDVLVDVLAETVRADTGKNGVVRLPVADGRITKIS